MRASAAAGLSVLLLAGGCAMAPRPVGRDFPKLAFSAFVLNRTTIDQLEADLGPPLKQSTMSGIAPPGAHGVAPGTRFSLVHLDYYYAPNGAGTGALHPHKNASLLCFDGRLVAFDFGTSLPDEVAPPVDESRLTGLQEGRTTREQVIAMLGTPNGAMIHVLDAQRGASALMYGWQKLSGGDVEQRSLTLTFDVSGRLTAYTLRDNDFPLNGPVFPSVPAVPHQSRPVPAPPSPGPEQLPPPDLSRT